eukprot:TRINITY_DN14196_c0_g1_i1.p2 TRINITY_DN14196_c0_g1~~TRINITY_DN14196_c0_g1_i1.p2  ORF type:complete len:273 (+),score=74.50 TRINITY_DN14196_c0_g1_i1:70-888(+)
MRRGAGARLRAAARQVAWQAGRRACGGVAADVEGGQLTVYVHGMREHDTRHLDEMLSVHRSRLAHRWGPASIAFAWPSGQWQPTLTPAKAAWWAAQCIAMRQLQGPNLPVLAAALGADTHRLVGAYVEAKAAVPAAAARLCRLLCAERPRRERLRVVAFSLGGAVALHAAAALPRGRRPDELHLICPPLYEEDSDVGAALRSPPAGRTVVYCSEWDWVLYGAMLPDGRAVPPIGAAGLRGSYPDVEERSIAGQVGAATAHSDACRLFHSFVV